MASRTDSFSTTESQDFATPHYPASVDSQQSNQTRYERDGGESAQFRRLRHTDTIKPPIPAGFCSQETFRSNQPARYSPSSIHRFATTPRSSSSIGSHLRHALGNSHLTEGSLVSGYSDRIAYDSSISISNASEPSTGSERERYPPRHSFPPSGPATVDMKEMDVPACPQPTRPQSPEPLRRPGRVEFELEAANEPPRVLDRLVMAVVEAFERHKGCIGLAALCLGLTALALMVVLIPLSKMRGDLQFARTAFCVCDVIMSLCCGIFMASINKSVGEAGLMMILILCYGMLFSTHLNVMLGMRSDEWPPTT